MLIDITAPVISLEKNENARKKSIGKALKRSKSYSGKNLEKNAKATSDNSLGILHGQTYYIHQSTNKRRAVEKNGQKMYTKTKSKSIGNVQPE